MNIFIRCTILFVARSVHDEQCVTTAYLQQEPSVVIFINIITLAPCRWFIFKKIYCT